MRKNLKSVSILGTVGVPANYGGFETLAENLVNYAEINRLDISLSVYCSGQKNEICTYKSASLRYLNIGANGISSILYDIVSLFSAVKRRDDVILLLGVSGALALPIIRLISSARIVTNIDGIEWKREKWGFFARSFLKISELIAVRFSHKVIADNEGISDHVSKYYGLPSDVIAYGGDHAITAGTSEYQGVLPDKYSLALCRIEPENNVELILDSFSKNNKAELVFIGNWSASDFGVRMKDKYGSYPNIHLLAPVYEYSVLKLIRGNAKHYIHGHSAGGTNPSLVEMMHFGIPIFAFDCSFNRYTTEQQASYFSTAEELGTLVSNMNDEEDVSGAAMKDIALKRYTWSVVGKQYYDILLKS